MFKKIANVMALAMVGGAAIILGASAASAQETIKVGIVLPQSGPNADYIKRYLNSGNIMAVREANDNGNVLGRKVNLIIEDSKLDPAGAVSAFRKLADVDHVLAVFTGFTPLTLPQLPLAEEKHVIVFAPATEHPDLTKSPWGVRMTSTPDKAGIKIAQTAVRMGLKTAATLAEDNESVRLQDRAFQTEFAKLGGKVVAGETYKSTDNEMRGQLTKLKAANPDAIYLLSSSGRPMALLFRQISEVGVKPKQIFANHLVEDREVKAIGQVTNGVIYTTFEVDKGFSERFKRDFGYDADANAGKHYDATMLLFESIKRAGTTDPVKVRDAVYNFGDFNGVLGKFTFSGTGEPNVFPILKIIKDGNYVRFDG
jgi:branched-chain amino acid transport system substrate-binding protein